MATRPKAIIESRNGEKFSPITIAKNVLTNNGQNLHDILSDRKEDMMTPTIENSSSMFKVGQGDNVDYSENVVDGAYESCVFKGKSLVNLSNLHKSFNDVTLSDYYVDTSLCETSKLKLGTPYTLMFYTTVHGGDHDIYRAFELGVGNVLHATNTHPTTTTSYSGTLVKNGWSKKCVTFTDFRGYKYLSLRPIRCNAPESGKSIRFSIKGFILLEGDWSNKDLPFNDYFEGICDCKSPILSNVGKNLFDGEIEAGRWLISGNLEKYNVTTGFRSANIITITPSSRYTISGNFKAIGYFVFGNKDGYITRYIGLPRSSQSMSFNTNPDECYGVWYTVDIEQTETNKPTNIQLEEASTVTSYEPYKSNILSANGDKIELTEDMFEQGTTAQYSANIGKTYQWMKENSTPSWNVRRLRLKELIKIQPNTKLILQNTDDFMYAIGGYGVDKLSLGTFDTSWVQNTTITIPQDVHYISFSIRKKDDTNITISDFKNTKFTLSKVDKTIVLRSLPNGVCDTLNVETGEYVQRIGEVVLNGSNDETFVAKGGWINDTHMSFDFKVSDAVKEKTNVITVISDKFKSVIRNSQSASSTDEFITNTSSGFIFVMIRKNRLNTQDLVGFKQWLSQNTLTVQYELATPVIKTVDLSGYPFAYKDGHVQLSSGSIEQSLTPKVEYSVVTNRNGQIRSNQKMVERHQKQLDRLQAMILTNLVNTQYEQTLTNLKYDLKNVREEVK